MEQCIMTNSAIRSGKDVHSSSCLNCRLSFDSHEEHIAHYQSDLHRFNLKRKIAGLLPVEKSVFDAKLEELRQFEVERAQKKSYFCEMCRRLFHSHAQYENHLMSKKHRQNELQVVSQRENFLADKNTKKIFDRNIEFTGEDCLFCALKSDSVEGNITHMLSVHSFSVPDVEYLVDFPGFLNYIRERIYFDCICICCERQFSSPEAVHNHIIDTSHTHMPYESSNLDSLSDFYNYEKLGVDYDAPIEMNEFQELVLPNSIVMGHRSNNLYYKKKRARILEGSLTTRSLTGEYKVTTAQKTSLDVMESKKRLNEKGLNNLKVSLKQNRLSKLRYRSDCPM